MTFKTFQNVPFKEIPKGERAKKGELSICNGGCNCMKSVDSTIYQLCSTCTKKWRYHGYECDVPNCESIGDGSVVLNVKDDKIVCHSCYQSWKLTYNFCIWERFVEMRHLRFLPPKAFV